MSTASNVFAVEAFSGSWRTIKGGLTRDEALVQARRIAAEGERVSVAEYTTDEGSSAVGREEVSA